VVFLEVNKEVNFVYLVLSGHIMDYMWMCSKCMKALELPCFMCDAIGRGRNSEFISFTFN